MGNGQVECSTLWTYNTDARKRYKCRPPLLLRGTTAKFSVVSPRHRPPRESHRYLPTNQQRESCPYLGLSLLRRSGSRLWTVSIFHINIRWFSSPSTMAESSQSWPFGSLQRRSRYSIMQLQFSPAVPKAGQTHNDLVHHTFDKVSRRRL